MGLLSRLRSKAPPARQNLHVPRYKVESGMYVCKKCKTSHYDLPYICRGCGVQLMRYADDRDLKIFYSKLERDLQPDEIYKCGCGRRVLHWDTFCRDCHARTAKTRSYPLPNFEVIDANHIRCGKCLRPQRLMRKLVLGIPRATYCSFCGASLIVTDYLKVFTTRRPVMPDISDRTMRRSKKIREMAEESKEKWRERKRWRLKYGFQQIEEKKKREREERVRSARNRHRPNPIEVSSPPINAIRAR